MNKEREENLNYHNQHIGPYLVSRLGSDDEFILGGIHQCSLGLLFNFPFPSFWGTDRFCVHRMLKYLISEICSSEV